MLFLTCFSLSVCSRWRFQVMSTIRKTPDQVDAMFQLIAESKINLEPVE